MRRYSRYSRYRTKSHVFPRYSRYQTVLLKLQEIGYYLIYKKLCYAGLFVFYLHPDNRKGFWKTHPECHPERRRGCEATEPSRSFAGRGCAFCNLLQKSAPQQAKPQAMTPGTVLCDVSAGHVTEGLYPVSWRRGICKRFLTRRRHKELLVGTGVLDCPQKYFDLVISPHCGEIPALRMTLGASEFIK